ncbi:hypothetical protein [Peribacillus deserti]|uniref:Uncharacterized protein n=1 Tax=Peribacillus deserti TaxID=673318 RepID=A0A2N5MA41_9BACI|nr:hypothetical protein [Peribacillus deserti]PLT31226.1 hypothetical protein CUU66_03355 [Peribacillus deserti]
MVSLFFSLLAMIILFFTNQMTASLCTQKEIPEDRQPGVFRTINILITILLISSYIEVLFT